MQIGGVEKAEHVDLRREAQKPEDVDFCILAVCCVDTSSGDGSGIRKNSERGAAVRNHRSEFLRIPLQEAKCVASVSRHRREQLDMRIAVAAEVDDLAAGDLDEVADAAGGHRFADEIAVGGRRAGCGGRTRRLPGVKLLPGRMRIVRRADDVRFAAGEIVGDFLPAVVAVIPFDADFSETADDLWEGDFGGERARTVDSMVATV